MNTTAAPHPPTNNQLLAALPAEDFARLRPHLEPLALPLGWALYESGDRQAHVYFPTEGIVSLLYVMENGASAEIACVGNEGLVGVVAVHGRGQHAEPRRSCRAPATPTGCQRRS
jgi:CRP-like cAMP-binding protein